MTYRSTVKAEHVGRMIVPESPRRVCERCPTVLARDSRPTTVLCKACYDVARTEKKAARLGVDLAALAEDEWFTSTGRIVKIAA